MDKIFYNANIYTMDDNIPHCQAMAIKNDIIYQVGSNSEILKLKTHNTEIIDLEGKTIIPGFNDSHLHIFSTGRLLTRVNLINSKSIQEIIDKLIKATSSKDNWIVGQGWNQDYFTDEKRFITKSDLDKVSLTKPIIIFRVCNHVAVVNSKALELAKITKDTIAPSGGKFSIDTGLFEEYAIDLITNIIPDFTYEETKEILLKGIRYANSNGITSVQTDDFNINYDTIIHAYQELEKDNLLTCRVYEQCLLSNMQILNSFIEDGYYTGFGSKYFKIGPLKLLADGSLGARTAALCNPYNDDKSTSGILTYTDDELYQLIKKARINNLQIAIHAIGDKAIKQVLNQYEKVLQEYPKKDHRFGIVHCQITDEDIINQFQKLNIIAYVQPIFINYDHKIVYSRVGDKLASTSYAFKTMINNNITTVLGTDSPVEDLNPFNNIYCAVTRKDLNGEPEEGYNPNEVLSVHEAVKHYTYYPSVASFEEKEKGLLKEGYLADFIVLNQDIFKIDLKDITNTKVLMTFCGGRLVYKL